METHLDLLEAPGSLPTSKGPPSSQEPSQQVPGVNLDEMKPPGASAVIGTEEEQGWRGGREDSNRGGGGVTFNSGVLYITQDKGKDRNYVTT